MKILSVPQDHCGSHNNFLKIFSKNYTLYGVYIFLNFGIHLNRLRVKNFCSGVDIRDKFTGIPRSRYRKCFMIKLRII